jgi:DNA replication protein DnaC
MLNEPTIEKLKALHLEVFAGAWETQQKSADTSKLPFDERLGLLVDAEWLHRENKRMENRLREAKLKMPQACLEDVNYGAARELDRAAVRQLASCRRVDEHHNVTITGMTGTGKTYLACALAQQACRKGHRALYRRASRLAGELGLARADGTYARLLDKLQRVEVLIIDDWGHAPLRDTDRHDLLEILDDRYGSRATIVTSQVPPKKWHAYINEPTHADAICDRLLHNAHRLVLKGPSRRNPKEEKSDQ